MQMISEFNRLIQKSSMGYARLSKRYQHQFFGNHPLNQFYHVKITPTLALSLEKANTLKEEIYQKKLKTNGNLQKAINDKLRYLWTYHSNALEGSRLTLGDTIFFLQEGLTVSGKPLKDFLDAKNHSEAIDYLQEVIQGALPIDPHLLCSLNALLLKNIEFISGRDALGKEVQKKVFPGRYKTEPNYVIQPDGSIHQYVEPFDVPFQLNDLCQWINESSKEKHPIIVASIAHYNKVRIHPFQDGNGRGSRILMNLILMHHQFPPAIIEVDRRKEYLECLKVADTGDLLPFTQYIADSVNKTQQIVLDEIDTYLNKANTTVPKPTSDFP